MYVKKPVNFILERVLGQIKTCTALALADAQYLLITGLNIRLCITVLQYFFSFNFKSPFVYCKRNISKIHIHIFDNS